MKLTKSLKSAITAHTLNCYPEECCGVVIGKTYYPCQNIALDKTNHFEIDPADFVRLSSLGEMKAIVHSHPNGTAEPSETDRIQMGLHGIDWIICGVGQDLLTNEWQFDVQIHKPATHHAPLLGREYVHSWQDCYTLVQDYYKRELDIKLPDFERTDNWWEFENHEPLYENNFRTAGFELVENFNELQAHDIILCRVGRTHHINHALIYLGDYELISESTPPTVGNNLILHHPHGALSRREIFGESWQRRAALAVRHKQFHTHKDG